MVAIERHTEATIDVDELDRVTFLHVKLPGVSRLVAVQRPDTLGREAWAAFAELLEQFATSSHISTSSR